MDEAAAPRELVFDLDSLDVGQITMFEMELNRQIRELIAPDIVTFSDVIAKFRYQRGAIDPETGLAAPPPRIMVPDGPVLQALGLLQLRETNPDATWEDAARLTLQHEVATPKGDPAAAMVAGAVEAAKLPEDPESILRTAMEDTVTFSPPTMPTSRTTSPDS